LTVTAVLYATAARYAIRGNAGRKLSYSVSGFSGPSQGHRLRGTALAFAFLGTWLLETVGVRSHLYGFWWAVAALLGVLAVSYVTPIAVHNARVKRSRPKGRPLPYR
jgi:hypothetical protein